MAATTPQTGAVSSQMPPTARSNVSVTSINCDGDGQYPFSTSAANGIRIAVPRMDGPSSDTESDTELSTIEFAQQVNLRTKPAHRPGGGAAVAGEDCEQAPRPMSWEGGLSDDDHMDTVEKTEQIMISDDTKPDVTKDYGKHSVGGGAGELIDASSSCDREMSLGDVKYERRDQGSALNGNPASSALYNGAVEHPMRSLHKGHGIIPDLLGSPLLARQHKSSLLPANPSPDSAIHSVYTHSSPSQSPLTARHTAPYTPSLSRNNSDASHSSCYSYSSEFSPAHSPIQGRHMAPALHGSPLHHSVLVRGSTATGGGAGGPGGEQGGGGGPLDASTAAMLSPRCDVTLLPGGALVAGGAADAEINAEHALAGAAGISRQQLINSPCPICGDKISGFHYGIFSCESCKGFFKRTVQNRKNYVCLRGASCPVSIATRKKCPACRFDKCLQRGMKLEAIREDRTRGGRSTYQCSYTLPAGNVLCPGSPHGGGGSGGGGGDTPHRAAPSPLSSSASSCSTPGGAGGGKTLNNGEPGVPALLQEIMDVEHLWQYNESELSKFTRSSQSLHHYHSGEGNHSSQAGMSLASNPLLARAGITTAAEDTNPDFLANLCNIADHRLYKIVKWCKSLPLFKNISIDDQICLLINSWCELLLFSCCYRSMGSPGEIRVSLGKSISLDQARHSGLQACIERMLNLTEHLRRLRVDRYEYVAMKVIVLLTSDTSELREPEKVRASQEKALQALQAYTLSHYPHSPAKFGELLLRIPELQRTCQVGKEMLTIKSKDGEGPSFNLLMELLRGEH